MDVARFVDELNATCVRPIQAQLMKQSKEEGVLYTLEMEESLDRLEASTGDVVQPTCNLPSMDTTWTDCADILVRIAMRYQYGNLTSSCPSSSIDLIALPVFRIVHILVALYEDIAMPSSSSSTTAIDGWAASMTHACTFYLCTRSSTLPSTHESRPAAQRIIEMVHRRLRPRESATTMTNAVDIFPRLLPRILSLFASKSSKEEWVVTGAAAPHAFAWFILQIPFPHFTSDIVGRVLALALPLLDQVTASTQLVGLSVLHHIIRHATTTDIRWYSDLLVHEMEQTLTTASTSASFLDAALACLADLLAVLSTGPRDISLYDRFFPSLLRQWDMALEVSVKTIFTKHIRVWVQRTGAPHSLHVLRFLQALLKVTLGCVENVEATMCMEALETLHAIVMAAWIRMPAHVEEATVSILKCLAYNELQRQVPLPNVDPLEKAQHFENVTAKCHVILYLLEQVSPADDGRSTVRAVLHHVEEGCSSLAPLCAGARQYLNDQKPSAIP